jgi:hypothetical protein
MDFNNLFGQKDALVYITAGIIGGIIGVYMRIRGRWHDTDLTNDKISLIDILDFIFIPLLGASLAVGVDIHFMVSFCLGLFAPIVYDILEKVAPSLLGKLAENKLLGKG